MLVSNNPYGSGRMLDLGRRARLAQGTLGVIAARLASTGRAVGLLRRAQYRSVTRCTAPGEVIIQADTPTVPVGIDGEAVTVCTPVHCTIRPPRPAGPAAVYLAGCPATAARGSTGPASGGSRSDARRRPAEIRSRDAPSWITGDRQSLRAATGERRWRVREREIDADEPSSPTGRHARLGPTAGPVSS